MNCLLQIIHTLQILATQYDPLLLSYLFSKHQVSSCIGYQSWHSSTGCSAQCNLVLHAFFRYDYFCIMGFLSSPSTSQLFSLGFKKKKKKSVHQQLQGSFILKNSLAFHQTVHLPTLQYQLFSPTACNHLGDPVYVVITLQSSMAVFQLAYFA